MTDLWTCRAWSEVIERQTGVAYHPGYTALDGTLRALDVVVPGFFQLAVSGWPWHAVALASVRVRRKLSEANQLRRGLILKPGPYGLPRSIALHHTGGSPLCHTRPFLQALGWRRSFATTLF